MRIENLYHPGRVVDVVLDTDTYNEIDDQFALAYLLKSPEACRVQALYAAPFFNENSESPEDGMEKSYDEILHLLQLMGREEVPVFKGSRTYLTRKETGTLTYRSENADYRLEADPVDSPAARDLAERAMQYTPEEPLYVAAIGAITNIASAILMNPEIVDRIVIIWLGGHSMHWPHTREFNMVQDIAAARVVFGCGAALVQLPCYGVVSEFTISEPELNAFFKGKNPLCDYLADHTIEAVRTYCQDPIWTRVIWDVTAVGWLICPEAFKSQLIPAPIPEFDGFYGGDGTRHPMCYVYKVERDLLMRDLVHKCTI